MRNVDFPAGAVKSAEQEITIRLAGKFKTAGDIADVTVTSRNGQTYILKMLPQLWTVLRKQNPSAVTMPTRQ
jgi:multidrug efflux pump subunit AcrB